MSNLQYSVEFGQYLNIFRKMMKNTVAENTSSYSDILRMNLHPETFKTGRRALLGYLVKCSLGLTPVEEMELKEKLSKICSRYREQGDWNILGKLLEQPTAPYLVLEAILNSRSSCAFFGNDVRLINKILKGLKLSSPYVKREVSVKKPQRKRGYDDKGSLRSSFTLPLEYWIRPKNRPNVIVKVHGRTYFSDLPKDEISGYPGGERFIIRAIEDQTGGGVIRWKIYDQKQKHFLKP